MLLRFYVALVLFALACAGLAAALGRRETATRCLTLAGLVTLLYGALLSVWSFAALLLAGAHYASRELGELDRGGESPMPLEAITWGVLLVVILVPLRDAISLGVAGVSIVAGVVAAWVLLDPGQGREGVPRTAVALLGVHVCAGLVALMLLLRLDLGVLLATIVMMQFNDGFAYLVGRQWGRTKLAPKVSPGKTVEGLIGGALASGVMLGVCHSEWFPLLRGASWVHGVGLWAIIVGIGVLGDLLYSLAKRRAALDDYGSSLPGHGGVLDRLDSLLACAPVIVAWQLLAG